MKTVKTNVEDLKPGDRVLLDLPCVAEVVKVEENSGRKSHEASHLMHVRAERLRADEGSVPIGSKVAVEVVQP